MAHIEQLGVKRHVNFHFCHTLFEMSSVWIRSAERDCLKQGFFIFLYHGPLWEYGETYGPLLRKMNLNAKKVHNLYQCITIYYTDCITKETKNAKTPLSITKK